MLWKKESNKLYTDICVLVTESGVRLKDVYPSTKSVKDDQLSKEKRIEGNEWFQKHDWTTAMELYNESLCLATPGSENISLAYNNRSACFFNMKMYEKCLIDNELAKKANCPARLIPKMNKRETDCLELIEKSNEQPSNEFHRKLSFDADEKFPCMANVLKLNRDENGLCHMVATEDIDVGKAIVVEKAFLTYLFERPGFKCNICLKIQSNLMPCTKCAIAMFCSDECLENVLHKHECGLKFCDNSRLNGFIMGIIRSTMLAIDLFSDADELMNFVEQVMQSDPKELPESLLDEHSKYRAFLKLPLGPSLFPYEHLPLLVFEAYDLLVQIPKVKSMFQTEEHIRFLMHLIGQHAYIVQYNLTILMPYLPTSSTGRPKRPISLITGVMKNYFKISCFPNVTMFSGIRDDVSIVTTIRPVKKGEDLSYIPLINKIVESKEVRQQDLWNEKQLICKCLRCEGVNATAAQKQRIRFDPDFDYINSEMSAWFNNTDDQKGRAIADKCAKFLQKHGHVKWCDELGKILYDYLFSLRAQNEFPAKFDDKF